VTRRVPILALLAFLMVSACGDAGDPGGGAPTTAPWDAPFTLQIGAATRVGGEVTLRFIDVTNDSRCPSGVQCIVAGEAKVLLHLTDPTGSVHQIELTTPGPGDSSAAAGYEVEIMSLDPGPPPVDGVDKSDYVGTFRIPQSG
jgi:hypothetical protein